MILQNDYISIVFYLVIILSFLYSIIRISVKQTEYTNLVRKANFHQSIDNQTKDFDFYIDKVCMDNYPYLQKIYKEMWPEDPSVNNIQLPIMQTPEEVNKQKWLETHFISIVLGKMEIMYLTFQNIAGKTWWDNPDLLGWTETWKAIITAPSIRNAWGINKGYYVKEFANFIDTYVMTQ